MAPKVSVILPTYNEKENLPLVLWLLEKHLGEAGVPFEVIVVDDGSPDGTADACRALKSVFNAAEARARNGGEKMLRRSVSFRRAASEISEPTPSQTRACVELAK